MLATSCSSETRRDAYAPQAEMPRKSQSSTLHLSSSGAYRIQTCGELCAGTRGLWRASNFNGVIQAHYTDGALSAGQREVRAASVSLNS